MKRLRQWMHPAYWATRARFTGGGTCSERYCRLIARVIAPCVRLAFRPHISGLELLPKDQPYLLVANHSGGIALAEILSFASLWVGEFQNSRPLAAMAHPFGFYVWPISAFLCGVGAVPSTYQHALAALAKNIPVLTFPGGDHEASRPIWQANRVDFAGRKGFLKLARAANVPIVPIGIQGSHYTAPIIARSRLLPWVLILPRLFGIRRFPLTLLGLIGALAITLGLPTISLPIRLVIVWAYLISLLPFLPIIPWSIRFRIGPPIQIDDLFPNDTTDDSMSLAYQQVASAVQRLVQVKNGSATQGA